ncbi:MAG: hypothetical protein GF350_05655 [Chitinivibrionales bacterium]|nr:hypothetical protein [Chitinivibrionales bacterium]
MNAAKKFFLIWVVPVLLLPRCSSDDIAGTGTETSTKSAVAQVSGTIVDRNGAPVSNVVVQLVPSEHDPVLSKSASLPIDITDEAGQYLLGVPDSGTYNVEAIHLSSTTRALVRDVFVDSDTLDIGQASLDNTGMLTVALPEHIDPVHGYVYIEGTSIFVNIASGQDSITLIGVPATKVPAVYYSQEGDPSEAVLLAVNVVVFPDETTSVFKALCVVGDSRNIRENDSLLKAHVQKIGGNIVFVNDECRCTETDPGVDVIIISSSSAADTVNGLFKDAQIPVIVCENDIYGDMMLTGPEPGDNFSNLYDPGTTAIRIVDPTHPIAIGFSGMVTLFDTLQAVSWGKPSSKATVIAVCDDSSEKAALFCYEKGAAMMGMDAPARRVAFFTDFYSSVIALNDDGWILFENSVFWAIGREE